MSHKNDKQNISNIPVCTRVSLSSSLFHPPSFSFSLSLSLSLSPSLSPSLHLSLPPSSLFPLLLPLPPYPLSRLSSLSLSLLPSLDHPSLTLLHISLSLTPFRRSLSFPFSLPLPVSHALAGFMRQETERLSVGSHLLSESLGNRGLGGGFTQRANETRTI